MSPGNTPLYPASPADSLTTDPGGVPAETYLADIQFRRLLEKLPAGAYLCAPDGLITYFNPRAVELWGRAPRLLHPEDRFCGSFKLFAADGSPIRHEECWMALALRRNAEYNGEEIIVERPDGSRLTVLAHANPIRDEGGTLLGAVNVLVDITERKRAEEALRAADRQKDEFLAVLAHELRNPLAPIMTATQVLQARSQDAVLVQRQAAIVERQARQMGRLLDDLLDVSRITHGKIELRREILEVTMVVNQAVEGCRPLLEQRGHTLTVDLPSAPAYLDADSLRLNQVLGNLLNNAAKYTPPGGNLKIKAEVTGETVAIHVADNGIGILPEFLPRLFDLFSQADQSLSRSESGLGIGLTMVQRLVELHGGSVQAFSEGPGKGSEFVIRLPLVPASGVDTIGRNSPTPPVAAMRRRVLIVDDNRDAAETVADLLELWGHEARYATDGRSGIAAFLEFRPEVLILDISMPGMDGFETLRGLRDVGTVDGTTLIAITGYGQEEDRSRTREAGFHYHLTKPIESEVLQRLLRERSPRHG